MPGFRRFEFSVARNAKQPILTLVPVMKSWIVRSDCRMSIRLTVDVTIVVPPCGASR
ncbi:MAG: hypothetical protein MI923_26265 [Phycisphaerales bacterium]|nr:hypothetical protein [Phycisphaerales bacterium]